MSTRGFGAVISVGAVAGAALGFYLVSLRVASERAQLEDVETSIAMTQRDIRLLQTELGTRGRLAQLERWNVKFIRLSAPSADQFVDGGFQLATLVKPDPRPVIGAPVVYASAPVDPAKIGQRLTGDADPDAPGITPPTTPSRPVSDLVHVASYTTTMAPAAPRRTVEQPKAGTTFKVEDGRSPTPKPVKSAAATKPIKSATADPLAPLSGAKGRAKAATHGDLAVKPNGKETGSD